MEQQTFTHFFIMLLLPLLMLQGVIMPNQKMSSKQTKTMVVFIHGTLLGIPFFKVLNETKKHESVRLRRLLDKKFYQNFLAKSRFHFTYLQPINSLGLEPIEKVSLLQFTHDEHLKPARSIISAGYDSLYSCVHEQNDNEYYTFGWLGRLSAGTRFLSAKILYEELIKERDRLLPTCDAVDIQLIGHSHGGNLALNLARVEKARGKKLKISSLIMYGTPVQSETSKYVDADIFEKIYHFFSPGDIVQVLDTVSTRDFFSRRQHKKNGSSKLIQIEVTVDRHVPSHAELWFTGFSLFFYRKKLSIYPLPISLFTPLLIDAHSKLAANSDFVRLQLSRKKNQYVIFKKHKNDIRSCSYDVPETWTHFVDHHVKLFKPFYKKQNSWFKQFCTVTGLFGLGEFLSAPFKEKGLD